MKGKPRARSGLECSGNTAVETGLWRDLLADGGALGEASPDCQAVRVKCAPPRHHGCCLSS